MKQELYKRPPLALCAEYTFCLYPISKTASRAYRIYFFLIKNTPQTPPKNLQNAHKKPNPPKKQQPTPQKHKTCMHACTHTHAYRCTKNPNPQHSNNNKKQINRKIKQQQQQKQTNKKPTNIYNTVSPRLP